MTSGEDIYRTFDNVYFHYHHPCAVGLLVSQWIDIYTFTECDPVDKCACYKVVHMIFQSNEFTTTYMLRNNELTITTPSGTVTRSASSLTPNEPSNLDENGKLAPDPPENCQKLDIFSKKMPKMFFFNKIADGNFVEKMTIFVNFF